MRRDFNNVFQISMNYQFHPIHRKIAVFFAAAVDFEAKSDWILMEWKHDQFISKPSMNYDHFFAAILHHTAVFQESSWNCKPCHGKGMDSSLQY